MRFAACLLVAFASSYALADKLGPQTLTFEDRVSAQVQIAVSTDVNVKVTLCHIPPGNPAKAQTIIVRQAAVAAHLAHGDYLGACHAACSGVPSPVPKTGVTLCYDDTFPYPNVIDCAGSGEDGEYQRGASVSPRFTDNRDGTVKDNLTGLIWLQNANCFDIQSWHDALIVSKSLANGACGLTDGSVAGAWRLPNVKELLSLIDFGQFSPALPAGHPFSGVQSDFYWSSTNWAANPHFAWDVYLDDGNDYNDVKSNGYYVWPVRGGP